MAAAFTPSSFSAADLSRPLVPDPLNPGKMKVDTSNFGYQSSTPGQIVVVRAVYEWPTFVTGLGLNLSDLSNNKRLLMSTAYASWPMSWITSAMTSAIACSVWRAINHTLAHGLESFRIHDRPKPSGS